MPSQARLSEGWGNKKALPAQRAGFSTFNTFGRDSPYPKYAEITVRVFLIFFPCRARNFSRHHFSHPNCFPWVSYL
jgi:hypothetical protein